VTFLHPLALLGLAAAAIPLLLHLFQRRTPPEAEFPAVRYLAEAERRTARRLRLRHRVLLLLRTALIVALVVAAARPLVPARGGATHAPTALVIVLDNSPSSGATGGGRLVLDRLRVTAGASLAAAGDADRLFLLLADGVLRAGSRAELLAVADSVRPASSRLDVVDAVRRAARLVQAEPLAAREVHVLSDLQVSALASGRADPPAEVTVLVLAPPEPVPNRGIAAAEVRDGAVAVTIGGTPGAAPGAVTLLVDDREVARALAAPGEQVSLALPAAAPGWRTAVVRLAPDELRADDARPVAWRVAPPARTTAAADAGPFVAAAIDVLREGGRVAAGSDVRIGAPPAPGAVVLPPADGALIGASNRALAAAGAGWRFGPPGTPGPLADSAGLGVSGIPVHRRHGLVGVGGEVLATVNGEPWLVRAGGLLVLASRLDTAWTALPATPAFVPFLDRLANGAARGERPVRTKHGNAGVAFEVRGADTVGAVVSGPDPRESDLTPAAPDVVERAIGAPALADARFARARFGGGRRADVAGGLLLVALLLAAVESVVAWRTR
jgi:hypothetical protein